MNTIRPLLALSLLSILSPQLSTAQGSLQPPSGAPAPSMKTLDQVEARIPLVAGQPGVAVSAAGTITISQPGSYYLTKNVTISTNVNGIEINADATVDLNGYSIIGTAAAITTGDAIIIATTANAAVRNGFIKGGTVLGADGYTFTRSGFESGVFATNPPAGVRSSVTVSDLQITGVRADGIFLRRSSRVERCTVGTCGGDGINVYQFILNLAPNNSRLIGLVRDCQATECGGEYGIAGDTVESSFGQSLAHSVSAGHLVCGIIGRVVEHSVGWSTGPWSGEANIGIYATVASYCTGRAPHQSAVAIDADTAVACRSETGGISSPEKHLGTP